MSFPSKFFILLLKISTKSKKSPFRNGKFSIDSNYFPPISTEKINIITNESETKPHSCIKKRGLLNSLTYNSSERKNSTPESVQDDLSQRKVDSVLFSQINRRGTVDCVLPPNSSPKSKV